MSLRDVLDALTGRRRREPELPTVPPVPTGSDLIDALRRINAQVSDPAVPGMVASRVRRICNIVGQTVPRLDNLGPGSAQAHSVMATATNYLPEALGGYLRLPEGWRDRRPVDGQRTSLMVLCDQLDLLAATMDDVFDAVNRLDAAALVAHGRFLEEKFGRGSTGGVLGQLGTP
jgi:hypothetical protein